MENPLFSIITPTYNSLHYLKECIKSVIKQNFGSFEHIIIDDGSNDGTRDYLINNKKRNQIILFSNHSGLPGIVRNIGIKHAKGKYISFLDADDLFEENKLYFLSKEIKKKMPDLLYHNEIESYRNKTFYMKYPSEIFISKENFIRFGNRFSTSTITIKKDFLIENNLFFSEDKDHKIVEDYHLWLRVLNFKPKLKKLKKYLSIYKIHKQGISNNKQQLFTNEINCIDDLLTKSFIKKNQSKFAYLRIELNKLLINKKENIKSILKLWLKRRNFFIISLLIFRRILETFLKTINLF